MKIALIFGVTGQDGTYLSELLSRKGYKIYGVSRGIKGIKNTIAENDGLNAKINLIFSDISNIEEVSAIIKILQPDEIYNLSGQSSVGLSYEEPAETFTSICYVTLNILDAVRLYSSKTKIYCAGSSECFGDTGNIKASENTKFNPISPYGVSKASAYWLVKNYRDVYGLFACTGILFNHESPLRPDNFVTKKIVKEACKISKGSKSKLYLGNIEIIRDWGWSEEYVESMWLQLQQNIPDDYIIATGVCHSLKEFVVEVFKQLELDWERHVRIDKTFIRQGEPKKICGCPDKARIKLGWKTKSDMRTIIKKLIANELT